MKKVKLKITTCKGRLMHTYDRQNQPQDRYIEVSSNGRLHIDWNAEIGNAVPAHVYHGIDIRIGGNWITKKEAREFISDNIDDFKTLVSGMKTRWNGNNKVGVLSDDAKLALETLEYNASMYY